MVHWRLLLHINVGSLPRWLVRRWDAAGLFPGAVELLGGQVYPVPQLLFSPDDDLGDDLNAVSLDEGLGDIAGAVGDNSDFLWLHGKNLKKVSNTNMISILLKNGIKLTRVLKRKQYP